MELPAPVMRALLDQRVELGAEDGVVFTPASPAEVAERILELLPDA